MMYNGSEANMATHHQQSVVPAGHASLQLVSAPHQSGLCLMPKWSMAHGKAWQQFHAHAWGEAVPSSYVRPAWRYTHSKTMPCCPLNVPIAAAAFHLLLESSRLLLKMSNACSMCLRWLTALCSGQQLLAWEILPLDRMHSSSSSSSSSSSQQRWLQACQMCWSSQGHTFSPRDSES